MIAVACPIPEEAPVTTATEPWMATRAPRSPGSGSELIIILLRLAAFRAFNATTELTGFLLHYDCRAGLCDTGPYPLPDGGFVIVRDHFLYEPFLHTRGLGEKDLGLALSLGDALSVDLPLAQVARERLAEGLGVPHTELNSTPTTTE